MAVVYFLLIFALIVMQYFLKVSLSIVALVYVDFEERKTKRFIHFAHYFNVTL